MDAGRSSPNEMAVVRPQSVTSCVSLAPTPSASEQDTKASQQSARTGAAHSSFDSCVASTSELGVWSCCAVSAAVCVGRVCSAHVKSTATMLSRSKSIAVAKAARRRANTIRSLLTNGLNCRQIGTNGVAGDLNGLRQLCPRAEQRINDADKVAGLRAPSVNRSI